MFEGVELWLKAGDMENNNGDIIAKVLSFKFY